MKPVAIAVLFLSVGLSIAVPFFPRYPVVNDQNRIPLEKRTLASRPSAIIPKLNGNMTLPPNPFSTGKGLPFPGHGPVVSRPSTTNVLRPLSAQFPSSSGPKHVINPSGTLRLPFNSTNASYRWLHKNGSHHHTGCHGSHRTHEPHATHVPERTGRNGNFISPSSFDSRPFTASYKVITTIGAISRETLTPKWMDSNGNLIGSYALSLSSSQVLKSQHPSSSTSTASYARKVSTAKARSLKSKRSEEVHGISRVRWKYMVVSENGQCSIFGERCTCQFDSFSLVAAKTWKMNFQSIKVFMLFL